MNIFSYKEYKELLKQMKKINNIYTLNSISMGITSGIILRHDIDFDIEKAYNLFKVEEEEHIKSSYFILTTSEVYNPNSRTNRKLIREIYNSGFEIGLHFDPTIYKEQDEEILYARAREECSILENIIEDKISSISLHCPSIHNQYPMFKGYNNAYSNRFFNPELYISDSCKGFRGKNIFSFIKKGDKHLIQVVLHPIHFADTEETYIQTFNKIFERKINSFDRDTRINKTYSNEIENGRLVDKMREYSNCDKC